MGKLGFDFTYENIEKLADLINDKELSEIAIEEGDLKITIKGKKCPPPREPFMPPAAFPMGAPGVSPAQAAPAQQEKTACKAIKAPIVGTFYAAPSPTSKPYVSVGDTVKKGDTVFIIESMKVMSEVQSELDGVVKEICVKNGEPVEFDQPLIILE